MVDGDKHLRKGGFNYFVRVLTPVKARPIRAP